MNTIPIISVIVPCYNQAHYMRETLDCLKVQTLSSWECIVVNDGSKDNTLEIAREYAAADGRFFVVDKPNGGLADARNAGIKASHGKYILPLDSDDKIGSSYLEKAVEYLEKHANTKVVYCKARHFGDRDDEWILPEYSYEGLIWQNQFFCSAVYRRSDYDKTNGYNSNMKFGYEDWDMWLSLLNKEDKVYQIPEVLFFYRKRGESMVSGTLNRTDQAYVQLVKNHPDIYIDYLPEILKWHNYLEFYQQECFRIWNMPFFNVYRRIVSLFKKR